MSVVGPRSSVFTTLLVHQNTLVADWPDHHSRLERHAKRLRIALPENTPELLPSDSHEWQLMRVSVNAQSQEWVVDYRPISVRNEAIDAITLPAPRWNQRTNGCKHGDWGAYKQAHQAAMAVGCDAALLVHEHAIVDADRATPLLLDEDGTVWVPSEADGGVDGITSALMERELKDNGFPVSRGRLNERLVARCHELILVGTGMGVCRVDSIDGEDIGSSTVLSTVAHRILDQHFTDEATWSHLRTHDE